MRFPVASLSKAALATVISFSSYAEARVFVITDTNDTTRVTSLRGAIIEATSHGLDDNSVIILTGSFGRDRSGSTFRLSIAGADEIYSRTGDLNITRGHLVINGLGKNVTIDATGLGDRIFEVSSNASLSLNHLTINGGSTPGDDLGYETDGEPGGAIWNAGNLTLNDCVVESNWSGHGFFGGSQAYGGGIYNLGRLEMYNCIVQENLSGNASVQGGPGSDGGGIYNEGIALLTKCIVSGNSAGAGGTADAEGNGGDGGSGGGIYNSGSMTLEDCTVGDNLSGTGAGGGAGSYTFDFNLGGPGGNGGEGGGIYNAGKLQIRRCTIASNRGGDGGMGGSPFSAPGNGGSGGDGGGICNQSFLDLETSTVTGNACGNGGPGGNGEIYGVGTGGDGGCGGGIFNSGTLNSTSCTIVSNLAGIGGSGGSSRGVDYAASGGPGGNGGGVFDDTNSLAFMLRNTIIALNSVQSGGAGGSSTYRLTQLPGDPLQTVYGVAGTNGSWPDVAGSFTSQGFNLVGAADGSIGFENGVNADQVGSMAAPIDPLIGPLQMNGGPTPTHALTPGSVAINQGKTFRLHRDQRGERRPYEYPSIANASGGDGSDIGAFELH